MDKSSHTMIFLKNFKNIKKEKRKAKFYKIKPEPGQVLGVAELTH
jgi:hypothetical protein